MKGIDAPEHRNRQAFEKESRVHLARLIAGKQINVEWQKRDLDDRIIGKIILDGRDICLEQVKAGFAWHYKKFEAEQDETDRKLYSEAEQAAGSQKLELWSESSQIPPWVFRDAAPN